jgi:hypothetical protein
VLTQDFNKDGNLDLAVSSPVFNRISVLPGRGDGTFPIADNYATGTNPFGFASDDFNQDGSVDLVTCNHDDATISVLPNADGTFVTLSSSPNPSKDGEPVTFTVTVASSLKPNIKGTGSVTLSARSKKSPRIKLANGVATFTTSQIPAGSYKVTATYSGDNNFNPNASAPLTQEVEP